MQSASLVYVGDDPHAPETLVLETEPGKEMTLGRIERELRSGLKQQVTPVIMDPNNQPLFVDYDRGDPAQIDQTMQIRISRAHCKLKCNLIRGQWTLTVKDCSSNGTWIFSVDNPELGYVRMSKDEQIPLSHGDRLCFGPPTLSIWHYQFKCLDASSGKATSSDGSSATATSSDGSAPPSVMQQLLDSLVQIEKLRQEVSKLNDVGFILRRDLDRSQKETQVETAKRIGLQNKLEDVEEKLEAELIVKEGLVKALTACKVDLEEANQDLESERAISRDLERVRNELERAAKKNIVDFGTLEDKSLAFGKYVPAGLDPHMQLEDYQSMVQTLAPEGASPGAAETPQVDATWNDWVPCPDTNPERSKTGRWVGSRNKRKNGSEKQESKEGSEKQESEEGSKRRSPRRT